MSKKKVVKKRVTWTFQPSQEVLSMAELLLGRSGAKDRGARTKLVNEAMKAAYPDEWKSVLRRKKEAIDAELSRLDGGKGARRG